MSDVLSRLEGVTEQGISVFTSLKLIQPGEVVVYHVGHLPRDRTQEPDGYRTTEVPPKEIELIVGMAEFARPARLLPIVRRSHSQRHIGLLRDRAGA